MKTYSSAAISPSGKYVAIGFESGALYLYSLVERKVVKELEKAHDTVLHRLRFAPDGYFLASSSYDSTVKLWTNFADGDLVESKIFESEEGVVEALAFAPEGKWLATAHDDGRIGLFSLDGQETRFIYDHEGGVVAMEFDPRGARRLLSAGDEDKTLRLWNLEADPPAQIKAVLESDENLQGATFSPDGLKVAIVGENGLAQVYSTQNAKLEHRLVGHEDRIYRAIFSPGGHQLATVSADNTLRLWDLDTDRELFSLRLPAQLSPDSEELPFSDFDFRCTPTGCWIAVPLARGQLALYEFGKIYD